MKGCSRFQSKPKESNPSTMIMFSKEQRTQETTLFTSSKTQGIDYGRKRCKSLVGFNVGYSPKGYRKGL